MPTTNPTRVYEAMFLVDTGDAAIWDDLTKHIEDILGRRGGELIGITRWDERKLAYPVAKHKRGTYVLTFFHMPDGDAVHEIENDCRLSEKILRVLVLKADHFTVADMRLQLGEDTRNDVAEKVMAARGENELPPPDVEAEAGAEPPADAPASEAAPAGAPVAEEAPAEAPADAAAPPPQTPESAEN
jgi:small subunit ribosomal protein S6